MIDLVTGNIIEADVDALINAVNCVGVMTNHDEWPRIESPGAVDGDGTVGATRECVDALWESPAQER